MRCQKTGKVIHHTKAAATIAAHRISKIVMNAYPCPHCRGWHIGHSNNPIRLANRITELLAQHATNLKRKDQ